MLLRTIYSTYFTAKALMECKMQTDRRRENYLSFFVGDDSEKSTFVIYLNTNMTSLFFVDGDDALSYF